jgi:glutamate-ammonia-ligase adenylyltransferase
MTLAARMTRCPLIHDPGPAQAVADRFAGLDPGLRALLAATAGCSPFLAGGMMREADWLEAALDGPPENALEAVLAIDADLASDALGTALRRAKARAGLLIALCDLGGVWPLETVTGALTRLADMAVDRAIRALIADEARRGRLPGGDAGMVVLAMGKLGAGELN